MRLTAIWALLLAAASAYDYDTWWYTQRLDHFSYVHDDFTWQQRYLTNDSYYKAGGPVFLYTGNEGDITLFLQNTGFMFTLAEEFGALLVFIEHRYYGESQPFPNATDASSMAWLSADQALADYAVMVAPIKAQFGLDADTPVVAFGGSYGGMLSSWMRMKYPNVVVGALAASAPVLQFEGVTDNEGFAAVNTRTFNSTAAGAACPAAIRRSWDALQALADQGADGLAQIERDLGVCAPLAAADVPTTLFAWLSDAWSYLAMVDYPYPAEFLGPMPAWPVEVACGFLADVPADDDAALLAGLRQAAGVYYNWTGEAGACYDISSDGPADLGDEAWDYQTCTELISGPFSELPAQNGVTDMFWPAPWSVDEWTAWCQGKFGVTPRLDFGPIDFWARDMHAASNIVFSQGTLDPWSAGGVQEDVSDTVVVVWIEDGAHHLDLRAPDAADPESVVEAREVERKWIGQWLGSGSASASA